MKECNSVKQSPIAGLAAYGGGAGGLIFRKGVDGYQIDRSLRFHSEDVSSLSRTPSAAGNRRTFTISVWVKRSAFSTSHADHILKTNNSFFRFDTDHKLVYFWSSSDSIRTSALFRDPSAWYHIVMAVDTTESTSTDRIKFWVNGVAQDTTGTAPSQNADLDVNNTAIHYLGSKSGGASSDNFDGYLADFRLIDGTALAATDFGEYDNYDVWQPKAYSGSFGTNGFHLKFADNSTSAALGTDSSGNNNTWTVNNLIVAGGVALPGARTAVFFDGTDDKITYTSNSNLYPGATFTLEAWVYRLDSQEIPVFYGTSVGHVGFRVLSNGGMGVERINTAFDLNYNGSGTSVQNGEWTHVAWTKTGGTLRAFINGSNVATATNNSFSYQGDFVTARTLNDNRKFAISDLHLVVGTALYTSNFTPPSTISAHANTKLLCFQNASSATTATVAPSGVSLTATSSPVPGAYPSSENYQIDSLLDSPTNYEADSGNNGGNYATLNPFDSSGTGTFSHGNLEALAPTSGNSFNIRATIAPTSGQWYWEYTMLKEFGIYGGIVLLSFDINTSSAINGNGGVAMGGGSLFNGGSNVSSSPTQAVTGDVMGFAWDVDNNSLEFFLNGTSQGTVSSIADGHYAPAVTCTPHSGGGGNIAANFGQRPFAYTPPTGHVSLCTQNFADPTIEDGSDYFDTKLYTGNGSSVTVSGLAFSPDFVWLKGRSDPDRHGLFDTVRGATKRLQSSETNAEDTQNGVTAFNSDGVAIGNYAEVNGNGRTYVAWSWDAGANSNKTYTVKVVSDSGNKYRFDDFGTSAVTLDLEEGSTYVFDQSDSSNSGHPLRFSTTANGTHGGGTEYTTGVTVTGTPGQAGAKTTIVVAASAPTLFYYCSVHSGMGGQANTNSTAGASNLDGNVQATVRANASAGFSLISVPSIDSTNTIRTAGHGLNAAPYFIISKNRDFSDHWFCYHKDVQTNNRQQLRLNTTEATITSGSDLWAHTSSVMGFNGALYVASGNTNNLIFYCFTPIEGYSAFGSFEGTDADPGPFVYLGFRPALIILKNADASQDWVIHDSTRSTHNEAFRHLHPNTTGAENTTENDNSIDILSNGFRPMGATGTNDATNGPSQTIVYAAFAENPFKTARAR